MSAREGPIKYNNNGYLEQLTCASPTVFKCTYFQDSEHTTHTRTHTHTHTQGTGTEEKVFGKRKIFIEDFKRTGMCRVFDLIPFSFLAPSYHCALGDWSVCCLLIGGMSPNSVVHRHFNSKADTLEICDHDHVTTSMKGFTPGGLSRLFSIIFVIIQKRNCHCMGVAGHPALRIASSISCTTLTMDWFMVVEGV